MYPYLRSVEFRNFKIFKRTNFGPFQPRTFHAVVGGNSIGKSCFLEGLAYVFGEQNLRKLRVSSIRRLRHRESPSPSQASHEDCSVAAAMCVGNEQLMIFVRKVVSDDSDVFMIDNKVVTFEKYLKELSTLHIDVKLPHFFLSHGTLSTFVIKTPEEITELLEEVSSSSVLRNKYDTLQRNRKQLDQNISLAEDKKRSSHKFLKQVTQNAESLSELESLLSRVDKATKEWALFMLYHYKHMKEGLERKVGQLEEEENALKCDMNATEIKLCEEKKRLDSLSRSKSDLEVQLKELQHSTRSITLAHVQAEVEALLKTLRVDDKTYDECSLELRDMEKSKEIAKEKLLKIQNLVQEFSDSHCICADKNSEQYKKYLELKKSFERKFIITLTELQCLQSSQTCSSRHLEELLSMRKHSVDKLKAKQSWEFTLRAEYAEGDEELQKRKEEQATVTRKESELKQAISNVEKRLASITRDLIGVKQDDDDELKRRIERMRNLSSLRSAFSGEPMARLNRELLRNAESSCAFDDPAPGVEYNEAMMEVLDDYEDCVLVRSKDAAEKYSDFLRTRSEQPETFIPMTECKAAAASQRKEAGVGSLLSENVPLESGHIKEVVRCLTEGVVVCQNEKERAAALQDGFDVISPRDVRPQQSEDPEHAGRATLEDRRESLKKKLADLKKQLVLVGREKEKIDRSHLRKLEITSRILDEKIKSATEAVGEAQRSLLEIEEMIRPVEEAVSGRVESITRLESKVASAGEDYFKDFSAEVGVDNIQEYYKPCKYCREDKDKKLKFTLEEKDLKKHLDSLAEAIELKRRYLTMWKDAVVETQEQMKDAQKRANTLSESMQITERKVIELEKEISANFSQKQVLLGTIVSLEREIRLTKAKYDERHLRVGERKFHLLMLEEDAIEAYEYLTVKGAGADGTTSIEEGTSQVEGTEQDEGTQSSEDSSDEGSTSIVSGTMTASSGGTQSSYQESSQEQSSQATDMDHSEDTLRFDWDACMDANLIDFDELDEWSKCMIGVDLILERCRELADRKQSLKEDVENIRKVGWTATKDKERASAAAAFENAKKVLDSWLVKLKGNRKAFKLVQNERKQVFQACLDAVTESVSTWFKAFTEYDRAATFLAPINPFEPYLEGITFGRWVPDRRSVANEDLSGGEKSILALALILSFDSYNRTSLFLADEIDAGMDPSNAAKFAMACMTKAKTSQVFASSRRDAFSYSADVFITPLKSGSVIYVDMREADVEDMEKTE